MEDFYTRRLAYHEAAHAVAAESLRPGSTTAVTLEEEAIKALRGVVICPASCSFEPGFSVGEFAVVVSASAYGEELSFGDVVGCGGDEDDLALLPISSRNLRKARKKAQKLVLNNSEKVGRIAEALLQKRTLTGDELRALL